MIKIAPRKGRNVDDEQLTQFIHDVNFLLSRGRTQRDIAELIGMHETNFSHYLAGKPPVTLFIINELRSVFRNVLKSRDKTAGTDRETAGLEVNEEDHVYDLREPDPEEKWTMIQKSLDTIMVSQQRIEEALKQPQKTRAKRKSPKTSSEEDKMP